MNRKVTPGKRHSKKGHAAKTRINTSKYSVSLNPVKLALSQHFFHFKDTFKRLYKDPLSSLMTVLVIAIALALPACLYLMVSNAQSLTERWQTTHDISIYIDGSVAENKLEDLRTSVSKRDDVQLARIVTADEALQELKKETKMDMISEAIGENPLPHTLIVSPSNELIKSPNDEPLNSLLAALQQLPSVTDVQLDAQWVMKLRSFISLLKRSVWLLAGLLALGVLLVVSNTIRLHVQQRQDEIEIKKLIGASDGFVRRPFLYLGFWYGLIGALLACLLVAIMLTALSGPAQQLSDLYASNFHLQGLGIVNNFWMIVMGTLLALSGAWLAAERTLHKIQVK